MATKKGGKSTLTDLELTALGIVWKKEGCTAYAVMREFSSSPSSHYRGSAGAIYPLVQRLEKRSLLSASAGKRGRRPHVTYSITRTGLAALRQWLTPPLPEGSAAITFDPLRTRTYFLAALAPEQRRDFATHAKTELEKQLTIVKAEVERYRRAGDALSVLAMKGAVHAIRARITWMTEVGTRLAELGESPARPT